MDKDFLENWQKEVTDTLGEETIATIGDQLGKLMTYNETMQNTLNEKDTEIQNLNKNNEKLVKANAGLLQQTTMGIVKPEQNEEKPENEVTFSSCFDKKGRFIERE